MARSLSVPANVCEISQILSSTGADQLGKGLVDCSCQGLPQALLATH